MKKIMLGELRKKKHQMKYGRFTLPIGKRTCLMGVLNRTPDSFSDGGKFLDDNIALRHVEKMIRTGADIIDVGGESTRPGSPGASVEEELERTIPIIKKISSSFNVPISIDTSKHKVAEEAIEAGAVIVNDVTALRADPRMAGVISDSGVGVTLMHMRGRPEYMQDNPFFEDLMSEIIQSLQESVNFALQAGIMHDKIIIDPGIGFGKTLEHNIAIVNRLSELKALNRPILIGTSRKSFIGEVLNRNVDARLMGTAATVATAIIRGADIVRVHDVEEMRDVAKMTDALMGRGYVY